MKDGFKVSKMHFWMIQSVKKEVFGRFFDLRLLDWLDFAYYDRTRCVPTFGNTTRSWRITQKSLKCIFEWSKVPKNGFLAVISTWDSWIDLILQIAIILNVLQHQAMLPGHGGSLKRYKNAFVDYSKGLIRGFWSFTRVWSVGSTWYCILW